MIKVLATDVDGVLTEGKIYVDSTNKETKSLCFQDFDALSDLRSMGIKLAIITGESNLFTDYVTDKFHPDYIYTSCKNKMIAIKEICEKESISAHEIAYVGDGKYDVDVLKNIGIGFCPKNGIPEAIRTADIILQSSGGEGCIREAVDYIVNCSQNVNLHINKGTALESIDRIIKEHNELTEAVLGSELIKAKIEKSIDIIANCFANRGQVLLCGNGGSAADAQHIATEFVSRFFMERNALNAEALTVNTSSLTAIANDYQYDRVFSRQVEAKGRKGDILIGITTSGSSLNVMNAFDSAKAIGMITIAFVGENYQNAMKHADILISIPSSSTPRIQEMHIMVGHIICEEVEKILFSEEGV